MISWLYSEVKGSDIKFKIYCVFVLFYNGTVYDIKGSNVFGMLIVELKMCSRIAKCFQLVPGEKLACEAAGFTRSNHKLNQVDWTNQYCQSSCVTR